MAEQNKPEGQQKDPGQAQVQQQSSKTEPNSNGKPTPAAPAKKSEQVTYVPGPEDPVSVQWAGHIFHANVPKAVENAEVIASARLNKFFKVGEFKPGDAVPTRDEPQEPKTPEQYRAHAIAWLKTMQTVNQLDEKWQGEETLRMKCGVGTDDIELLMGLFQPKRAELRKRDMG